jgi:hypothetical protein
MSHFKPICPRCGDLLPVNTVRCGACGALSGIKHAVRSVHAKRRHRAAPVLVTAKPASNQPPDPRPLETTAARYVVRELEGYRITLPIRLLAYNAKPGIECVVLDTAWNHRQVANFTAEQFRGNRSRRAMFAACREAAANRCDLLNRLDEIATRKREAVQAHSESAA